MTAPRGHEQCLVGQGTRMSPKFPDAAFNARRIASSRSRPVRFQPDDEEGESGHEAVTIFRSSAGSLL